MCCLKGISSSSIAFSVLLKFVHPRITRENENLSFHLKVKGETLSSDSK